MYKQYRIQDFPEGGRQPLSLGQKPIIWQYFYLKLQGNERNWIDKGDTRL